MPTSDELADSLEALLRQIMCWKNESDLESMVDLDLSVSQFRCLVLLAQEGEAIPIHELAQRLQLSMATTGRNVDRLVEHKLVVRREDSQDRRVRRVSLSAVGARVASHIDEARRSALLGFARSLQPEQREALNTALRQVIEPAPAHS